MRWLAPCLSLLVGPLAPAAEPDPQRLLGELSSEVFKTREGAEAALREWATREPKAAEELFSGQMETAADPELKARCRALLKHVVLLEYRKQGEGYVGIQMREEPLVLGANGAGGIGIRILAVVPDTPAAKVGMQPGDLVLAFEGKGWDQPDAMQRFSEEIRKHRPGQRVKLRVRRGQEDKELEIELARRPEPEVLLQNGLFAGGFGVEGVDPLKEQAKLQAQAEENYFREWLARRGQEQTPPPRPAPRD